LGVGSEQLVFPNTQHPTPNTQHLLSASGLLSPFDTRRPARL
jgi:hypothetical protein